MAKTPEKLLAKARASYLRNRTTRIASMRVRYQNERQIVVARLGGKCVCCGETEPLFLTIDHVMNDGYAMPRASYNRMSRWLIKNDFPDGFQLLCMNCNHGKHRNGGICPHQTGSTTRSFDRSSKRSEAPEALPRAMR